MTTGKASIAPARDVSLVEMEILRSKLIAIASEMGVVLASSAPSREINSGREHATAIVDRGGAVAAIENASHLGSLAQTALFTIEYFKFDMKDGDVCLVSDPYRGGTHVQDVTLLMPYVVDNVIVLYLVARAHMPDIGGQVAGSYLPIAREIWAEGVPFSPIKIRKYGQPVRDVLSTFLLNSRQPDTLRGNLDAQLAALELGKRRIRELGTVFGLETLRAALGYAQTYTERRVRAEIASWPDGTYDGQRLLDHDCAGTESVAIRVRAQVAGDGLTLDFTASDGQRPSFVNSTLGTTTGMAMLPLLALLGSDTPANSGILRAVRIVCKPGTIVHAVPPAAVGWCKTHCGAEIIEATADALRRAKPGIIGTQTVPGAMVAIRGRAAGAHPLQLTPWAISGAPACNDHDGWGRPNPASRPVLPSVEQWEIETGIVVHALEFAIDTGGAGRFRGAPALETELEIGAEYLGTVCLEGRQYRSAGVAGGIDGSAGDIVLEPADGAGIKVDGVWIDRPLPRGRLRLRLGGGGGFGNPMERDREAVADDVADGYVSVAAAAGTYGLNVECNDGNPGRSSHG